MMQRDDMSGDLHAHGSRELVKDEYIANNQWWPDMPMPVEEAVPEAAAAADSEATAEARSGDRDLANAVAAPTVMSTGDAEAEFLEYKTKSGFYANLEDNVCAGRSGDRDLANAVAAPTVMSTGDA